MTIQAMLVVIFSIFASMACVAVMAFLLFQNYNLRDEIDQVNRRNAKLVEYIRAHDPDNQPRKPARTLIAEMQMENAADETQVVKLPEAEVVEPVRITHTPTSAVASTMINVPVQPRGMSETVEMQSVA